MESITTAQTRTCPPSGTTETTPSRQGTKEWADTTVNIANGCAHDCRYCYAREMALRFGRVSSHAEWADETIKQAMPKIRSLPGKIMFPSTHDITPALLEPSITLLTQLLTKGNQVVVVSKPHFECVERMCGEFAAYKNQLLFRFTIGSHEDADTTFWEPGAPLATERIRCLIHAHRLGYSTSVSIEPMLAGTDLAFLTFHTVAPFVTEKIWIGKMNNINRRVIRQNSTVQSRCDQLQQLQSDAEIVRLVRLLNSEPKVAWKDSIRQVIARNSAAICS